MALMALLRTLDTAVRRMGHLMLQVCFVCVTFRFLLLVLSPFGPTSWTWDRWFDFF